MSQNYQTFRPNLGPASMVAPIHGMVTLYTNKGSTAEKGEQKKVGRKVVGYGLPVTPRIMHHKETANRNADGLSHQAIPQG